MSRPTIRHGLSHTPEYRAWQTARHRCTNPASPAFPSYGGRGITMCARWLADPAAFLADVGPRPSPWHELDRIDNDGNYEPGNVRWATRSENDRNRRSTAWVTFRGQRRRVIDVAEEFGVRIDVAKWRLRQGWDPERALTTPSRPKAPKGFGRDAVRRALEAVA